MGTFEDVSTDRGFTFRPPRSVMKGGLARAAAAGQQATNAGLAGGASAGDMKAAMSPEVESLQAGLRESQIRQNLGQTMTEIRTLGYIDNATDSQAKQDAYYNEMNRTSWDEALVKGAAVAQVLSGVAGIIADKGTKTVETQSYVDKEGNPITEAQARQNADFSPTDPASARGNTGAAGVANYLQANAARDENGQPLKITQKEVQKSASAKTAERLQDALGSIFPNIKRYNESKRQAVADSVDVFNSQRKVAMVQRMGSIDERAGLRRDLEDAKQMRDLYMDLYRTEGANAERLGAMVARQESDITAITARLGRDGDSADALQVPDGVWSPLVLAFAPGEAPQGFNTWNNIVNVTDENGNVVMQKNEDGSLKLDKNGKPIPKRKTIGSTAAGMPIQDAPWNVDRKSADQFTLDEIKALGDKDRPGGRALFAFGAGQIVPDTLVAVADSLGMKGDTKMGPEGQMQLIGGILGGNKVIMKYITSPNPSDEDLLLAADEIPPIWAGVKTRLVPGDKKRTGKGWHDGDGLNTATVDYANILAALRESRQRYQDQLIAGGGR